jgi:hypothetical protein
MVNMKKKYSDNQHAVIIFVFDIFDFLLLDSRYFAKKVERVFPRSAIVVFKMINFVIKKKVCVICLSFTCN